MPPEPGGSGSGSVNDVGSGDEDRDDGLIGSWDLAGDVRDGSGHGRQGRPVGGAVFGSSTDPAVSRPVARLAGDGGRFEVEGVTIPGQDFSLSAWINVPAAARSTIGDIAARFDAAERRGFSVGVHHGSPCGNHGNDRNLFFGIDSGTTPVWTDHGRPSASTIMVCALAVHGGSLYAATWEAGTSDTGHVYRLEDETWVDCGTPGEANAVTRLAVHAGGLYAATSRLRAGGSDMPESTNPAAGGQVLRYEGGREWSNVLRLDGADAIAGLVPFAGELHAIPMYSEGMVRLAADGTWSSCGSPGRRLLALGVHAGALYGAGNDHVDVASAVAQTAAGIVVPARSPEGGGGVFRYDPESGWTSLGLQPDTTQVYSIETYEDRLHIGTWPHGIVFRHAHGQWEACGQVGDETEVMNLLAFNGKLYAGTLPGAEVRRLDDAGWALVGTLDRTPDVRYRRVASMAVFRGELFAGTLPSGRVHSMTVGLVASDDRALGTGWRHVAAIRRGPAAELFIDGELVGRRAGDGVRSLGLDRPETLTLGGGPRGGFEGELANVRLHDRALTEGQVQAAAARPPS